MTLRDFFRESDRITNVKIICKDGLVFTHKIIVASVNNFFKDIIGVVPNGDDVLLVMPDHEKRKVEVMLKFDWLREVDNTKSFNEIGEVKKENNAEPHLERKEDTVKEEMNRLKIERNVQDESVLYGPDKEVFTGVDYENYFGDIEKEEYKQSIMKLLEELESKTVTRPSNPEEEKMFKLLQKQIRFERAKLDLLTGKFKTISGARRAHGGLNYPTLKRLFQEKRSYVGHNKKAQNVFTTLEEQTIIDEFVQKNNGVKEYKLKLLHSVIVEKIKELQNLNPEKDFSKYLSKDSVFPKQLAWKIAKKFGLTIPRPEAKFECEICGLSYSMKNTLNRHLKDVHFL